MAKVTLAIQQAIPQFAAYQCLLWFESLHVLNPAESAI
jgi:hypothetical protein